MAMKRKRRKNPMNRFEDIAETLVEITDEIEDIGFEIEERVSTRTAKKSEFEKLRLIKLLDKHIDEAARLAAKISKLPA